MKKRLIDAYRFPEFTPTQKTEQVAWDDKAIAIVLNRRQKKQFVLSVDIRTKVSMIVASSTSKIFHAVTCVCTWLSKSDVLIVVGVA
jgi:hypothetical protein